MSEVRRNAAAGGSRLLLLTVLFGLFTLHVLTAHGASHEAPSTPGHAGHTPAMAVAMPVSEAGLHPMAAPAITAGQVVTRHLAAPAMPGHGGGLLMCWLLLTAGAVLAAALLRRHPGADAPSDHRSDRRSPTRGTPRAPPGRRRLLELAILRV